MKTTVYVLKENSDCTFIQLTRTRTGKEFLGMNLVEHIKGNGTRIKPDILVFQDQATCINRDLIVFEGVFYYTDLYNGLLKRDRDNLQYIFPVV